MLKPSPLRFLICGLGSIGERHYGLLQNLLAEPPIIYRSRGLAPRTLPDLRHKPLRIFTDLDVALAEKPDAVLICNPTSLHMTVALRAAQAGCHLLIEKPLSHTLEDIDQLMEVVEKKKLVAMVAYMLRFHPLIIKMKSILDKKILGEVVHYQSRWSDFMPDWHPWEDYKTSYAARKELGGGVSLTLSHDLDLAYWLMPELQLVKSVEHAGSLPIDVDQKSEFYFSSPDGATALVQLDYLGQPPCRQINIECENGHLFFDYHHTLLKISPKSQPEEIITAPDFQRNDLYRDELIYFINAIENTLPVQPNLRDGRKVLTWAVQPRELL